MLKTFQILSALILVFLGLFLLIEDKNFAIGIAFISGVLGWVIAFICKGDKNV